MTSDEIKLKEEILYLKIEALDLKKTLVSYQ